MAPTRENDRTTFFKRMRAHAKQKKKDLVKSDQDAECEGLDLIEKGQEDSQKQDERIASALAKAQENKNARYERETELREQYARKILHFMYAYFIVVMGVIFMQGFSVFGFEISDTLLGILIGSAFAGAVGLVRFVVQGLFPMRGGD